MFVNFVYLHNAINRLISIETVHLLRRRVLLLFFVQARFRYCYEQVFRIYTSGQGQLAIICIVA